MSEELLELGSLYERHAGDVYRFALYLSGNATLAEDIVSETFLRVWGARERVGVATVKGYLFAITRNLFLQSRRTGQRHDALSDRLEDPARRADETAETESELRAVIEALQSLPELDRSAILLRAFEGLPYDEVAATLGVTEGAAKVRVHRARRQLAAALERKERR
jgi:RNA polymerase sigma-70 factor (ECF subfamily)